MCHLTYKYSSVAEAEQVHHYRFDSVHNFGAYMHHTV